MVGIREWIILLQVFLFQLSVADRFGRNSLLQILGLGSLGDRGAVHDRGHLPKRASRLPRLQQLLLQAGPGRRQVCL